MQRMQCMKHYSFFFDARMASSACLFSRRFCLASGVATVPKMTVTF